MDIYVVTDSDDSVENDEVISLLRKKVDCITDDVSVAFISGTYNHFRSVLDWSASICRAHHKLGRKLILEQEDEDAVYKLLLQAANRAMTGDGDHLVSDYLEVQAKVLKARQAGAWPDKEEGTVGEAVGRYKEFMKQCGLVDRWEVVRASLETVEIERNVLVVWGLGEERELLNILGGGSVTPVSLLLGNVRVGSKTDIENVDVDDSIKLRDMGYKSLSNVVSILRLVICSRDELSLARAVTASKLLTLQEFSLVRREAEAMNMSMYQSIISFVRKVGLGGKGYQPDEENALYNVKDSLIEFNRIMEKVQEKMEETSGAVPAIVAVVSIVRNWLSKQGLDVPYDAVDQFEEIAKEVEIRLSSLQATPARGLMGRPAVKLLTGVLDLMASSYQFANKQLCGKTPARQVKLVESFQTPQPAVDLDPNDELDSLVLEKSLSERLGAGDLSGVDTPVPRPSYPRFKSVNDFTEGSPALLGSAKREDIVTGGATLVARGTSNFGESPCATVESTRRILQEIKDKEEQENLDKMERAKEGIKKTKRCLAKEVDGAVREKMGLKRKSEDGIKENVKKPKKKFDTPKGQRKLTSFFTK